MGNVQKWPADLVDLFRIADNESKALQIELDEQVANGN
jgi:hypothetical protein